MHNSEKNKIDIASLEKDITECKRIISDYNNSVFLDREKAINKIIELRQKDEDILIATAANMLAMPPTPFPNAPDSQIVAELNAQINILEAKLAKKLIENINGNGGNNNAHP